MQALLQDHPKTKLIIIDTLGRSRADKGRRDNNIYQADYELLAELQTFAHNHKICILLVHHTKKGEEENVYDEISGTTGITAAADSIIVLKKVNEKYILSITGRDIPEALYQLDFNQTTCSWTISDTDNSSMPLTPERQEILRLFSEHEGQLKTEFIADALGKHKSTVSKLLKKLVDARFLESPKYGYYRIPEKE